MFGGQTTGNSKVIDSVERYDPLSDSWQLLRTRLPTARFGHGAAVYHDKVVIVGGSSAKSKSPHLTDVVSFDPMSESWTRMTPLSTPRCFVSVAVACDTIFAIGGYNAEAKYLTSSEAFSDLTGESAAHLML